MPLNKYFVPFLCSISKSNERVPCDERSNLTTAIYENKMCNGGLLTNMNPRSSGYKNPLLDLQEHGKHFEPATLEIK